MSERIREVTEGAFKDEDSRQLFIRRELRTNLTFIPKMDAPAPSKCVGCDVMTLQQLKETRGQ